MDKLFDQELVSKSSDNTLFLILVKCIPFFLSIFSFLLAWYLFGCFNLNFPIAYDGSDTLFISWLIKRVIDGYWYFNGVYSGFPFGSVFLDFPLSDSGNFAICKLLGLITHKYILTQNLYFLFGFSVTATVSYLVLQNLGISKNFSFVGAILFAFLPFHFLRLGHIFYTWYFSIPIYVWYAYKVYLNKPLFFESSSDKWKKIKSIITLFSLACFGVYFAFFAVLMLMASGIAGSLKWKSSKNLISAGFTIFILTMSVIINITPNVIYSYKHGQNNELVSRLPFESELYGLKLVEMLLPQPIHRFKFFFNLSTKYRGFPLVNENITSSLGLLGSIGLIILLGVVLLNPFFGNPPDYRLQLFAFITITLFLFATIGGFSSLFAMFATPLIRAWNRVSVFIGFTSIAAVLLVTEKLIKRFIKLKFSNIISFCLSIFLIGFGILDQTVSTNPEYTDQLKQQFLTDQHFVQKIESTIPGGAVYQLPYLPFPDDAGLFIKNFDLKSYDFFRGYLHSSNLHWSFGGMKGRSGDLFFRHLAEQPISQQLEVVKTLGFNGIYIDRRGYVDHGKNIEKKLSSLIDNKIKFVSEDNQLVFYKL